jgi:hypothetical protein
MTVRSSCSASRRVRKRHHWTAGRRGRWMSDTSSRRTPEAGSRPEGDEAAARLLLLESLGKVPPSGGLSRAGAAGATKPRHLRPAPRRGRTTARAHSALRGRTAADDHRDRRKTGPRSARAAARLCRDPTPARTMAALSRRPAKADHRSPLAPSWKSMPATSSSNHGPRRILSASRSTDQSFALLVCRRASLSRYGGTATRCWDAEGRVPPGNRSRPARSQRPRWHGRPSLPMFAPRPWGDAG